MGNSAEVSYSYEQLHESELVILIRSGHEDAFGEIIRRYRYRLYSTALVMLDSPVAAEQALQDAISYAYKNVHKYKNSESLFFSWLCKQVIDYVFRHYTMPIEDKPAELRSIPLPED